MLGFSPISAAPLSDLGSVGYTLTADAGAVVLTGADSTLQWSGNPILTADPGSITLTGASSNLIVGYVLTADPGSVTLTGEPSNLHAGNYLTANAGSIVLTGASSALRFGRVLTVSPDSIVLTGADTLIDAQIDEEFVCNILIHIYVDAQPGNYATYSHALSADGTPIKLRTWTYDEAAQDLFGKFNGSLANLSQRSLLTTDAAIDLTVNGQTIIDTGRLDRKDYNLSRQGIGPADSVTFVAMPEMETLLNKVPSVPLVLVDPEKHTVTADDFEGIYDTENNYTAPTVTSVAELSLYEILQRIMVDICGFSGFVCGIEDFPIPLIEFQPGVAYWNTIKNEIGMYEPYIKTSNGVLVIEDGFAGIPPGMPAPRQIGVSNATSLGVSTELARIDSLEITVTKDRFYYDYATDRPPEFETITEGEIGLYSQGTSTLITSYYRDFYRDSQPNTPVKTELKRQTTSVQLLPSAEVFLTTDEYNYFDRWGRIYQRRKTTNAKVPNPFLSFTIGLTEVEVEDEYITYKKHPYEPRTYYTAKREINKGGILYIDSDNPQLGTSYARDVINAYRSGNVVDTMTGVYGKISQFIETITPRRNKRIKVSNYEVDFTPVSVGLAPIFLQGEVAERDGEVGVNIFVQEQQKMFLFAEGETEIGGTIERVNMGHLPQERAVALGRRILMQRNGMPETVALRVPYIDLSLDKGLPVNAIGRDGEDLGDYIIEARTFGMEEFDRTKGPTAFMTLQARQAQ